MFLEFGSGTNCVHSDIGEQHKVFSKPLNSNKKGFINIVSLCSVIIQGFFWIQRFKKQKCLVQGLFRN